MLLVLRGNVSEQTPQTPPHQAIDPRSQTEQKTDEAVAFAKRIPSGIAVVETLAKKHALSGEGKKTAIDVLAKQIMEIEITTTKGTTHKPYTNAKEFAYAMADDILMYVEHKKLRIEDGKVIDNANLGVSKGNVVPPITNPIQKVFDDAYWAVKEMLNPMPKPKVVSQSPPEPPKIGKSR
jgi:hypothetical protein